MNKETNDKEVAKLFIIVIVIYILLVVLMKLT
jgi:hypothetical protein